MPPLGNWISYRLCCSFVWIEFWYVVYLCWESVLHLRIHNLGLGSESGSKVQGLSQLYALVISQSSRYSELLLAWTSIHSAKMLPGAYTQRSRFRHASPLTSFSTTPFTELIAIILNPQTISRLPVWNEKKLQYSYAMKTHLMIWYCLNTSSFMSSIYPLASEEEVGGCCLASFLVLSFPVYPGPGIYNIWC